MMINVRSNTLGIGNNEYDRIKYGSGAKITSKKKNIRGLINKDLKFEKRCV